MRAIGMMALLLAAMATASAGELPSGLLRSSSELVAVSRVRTVTDLLLNETVDIAKLAQALGTREIRRTEDKSPIRPNEQIYFAATEQFNALRLSLELDQKGSSPHSLYLTPTGQSDLSLTRMDQIFGAARLVQGPDSTLRNWIYGSANQKFVAQLTGEFAQTPQPTSLLVRLTVRIDRR
jgi:hypothetical protein